MKLSIAFSPCPNDTYILDALVNGKIDTEGLSFEPTLQDVQALNEAAASAQYDITKLSFPAYFDNENEYQLLRTGAALGNGVGPLLVARKLVDVGDNPSVAIPGWNTTANFLLSFAFPHLKNKTALSFDAIEDAVLEERFALGLLIHENRFTYAQRGLHKIADLGEVWEVKQGLPIPLGCIAAKKSLGEETIRKIESLIQKSLQYSRSQKGVSDYIKTHAQAMDPKVMQQHIDLYVNNYTEDLGEGGLKAIEALRSEYNKQREVKA